MGDPLPSTRALAAQAGVSFHTVRKAYHQLQKEGIIELTPEGRFRITQRTPLPKSERMEKGAAIIHEALEKMVGLGLQGEDIEYLLQEQVDMMDSESVRRKLVFVGPYREMAELCAEQLEKALQQPVFGVGLDEAGRHRDADYVFSLFSSLQSTADLLPHVDAIGVLVHFNQEALDRVARLLSHQTVGIVARDNQSLPHIMAELKSCTGFTGQMIAATIDERPHHLNTLLARVDVLLITPPCRRRIRSLLNQERPFTLVHPLVSADSIEVIMKSIPV